VSIRFLTAGESHGKGLVVIVEGFPAQLTISEDEVNQELYRRQQGYGRGGRMLIEKDRAEFISGLRHGKTLGSPIAVLVHNQDYKNWEKVMNPFPVETFKGNPLLRPRPGHADLAGGIKYNHRDLRNVLERASARETTMRVVAGALAKIFLKEFNVAIQSHVVQLGKALSKINSLKLDQINAKADRSPVRMLDSSAEKKAIQLIDQAKKKGDTLGGIFEVIISGVPMGLGSYVQWDRKLDGRLAQAFLSMQAVKGVEFGNAFENATQWGSKVHDEIGYMKNKGFFHYSNHAGGIEGGMSNGEKIWIRVAKKPISTLRTPLKSIDIATKRELKAAYERSDVCALPAASVIGEAISAWVMMDFFVEKFSGDFLDEIKKRYQLYLKHLQTY
jgi:chorismate synthase